MSRLYNEIDLSFYTEKDNEDISVNVTTKGKAISWKPMDDVEGYAIYRGMNGPKRIKPQRYFKIVVINTHRNKMDPDHTIPTRENVAVSEIEMIKLGELVDATDTLPINHFTSSSSYNAETTADKAFDNKRFEDKEGWHSNVIDYKNKEDKLREWIAVDFGMPVKIEKIRIQNTLDSLGLCGIRDYRIDVSNDRVNWNPLVQGRLDRVADMQEINISEYFIPILESQIGWQLLETVGSSTTTYVDSESEVYMSDYKVTGIVEGDISFETIDVEYEDVIDEEGNVIGRSSKEIIDLKMTEGTESLRQDITNRVRSQKGQWRSHQELGSDLELLEGEPNTRDIADRGVAMIKESLLADNRVNAEDLTVRPVPVSISQVDYYMIVDSDENGEPIVVVNELGM